MLTLKDETMMTIHFNAKLREVVGNQVGMLHWIMDPEVSGFIIGYDLDDNQVLICNFDVRTRSDAQDQLLTLKSLRRIRSKAGMKLIATKFSQQRSESPFFLMCSAGGRGSSVGKLPKATIKATYSCQCPRCNNRYMLT